MPDIASNFIFRATDASVTSTIEQQTAAIKAQAASLRDLASAYAQSQAAASRSASRTNAQPTPRTGTASSGNPAAQLSDAERRLLAFDTQVKRVLAQEEAEVIKLAVTWRKSYNTAEEAMAAAQEHLQRIVDVRKGWDIEADNQRIVDATVKMRQAEEQNNKTGFSFDNLGNTKRLWKGDIKR